MLALYRLPCSIQRYGPGYIGLIANVANYASGVFEPIIVLGSHEGIKFLSRERPTICSFGKEVLLLMPFHLADEAMTAIRNLAPPQFGYQISLKRALTAEQWKD